MRRSALRLPVLALAVFSVLGASCGDDAEPAAAEPEAPAGTQPTTTQPATTAPSTTAPSTTQPSTTQPSTAVPDVDLVDLGGPVDRNGPGARPDSLPPIIVENGVGEPQPGWTLFNLRRFGDPDDDPVGLVVMLDDAGEVVWAVENDGFAGDTMLTAAATVMYVLDDSVLREVDLEGRIVREYLSATATERPDPPHPVVRVDVETFHHEVAELANGNLLVLASETREFESPTPLCGEDPATFDGTYQVVGDEVVEFDRASGAVVSRRSLFDVFDPFTTPGTDFCTFGAPFGPFPGDPERNDWTHANSAEPTADGLVLVSVRHLETIVAWPLDDPAADPVWIFGPGGTLEAAPGEEFLHQHAPEMLADGTLLVYDNGNGRIDPGTGDPVDPPFSRVIGYDLSSATPEVTWDYRRESRGETVYVPAVGDVDRLDNGNTLIVDGFVDLDRAEIVEIGADDELVRLITIDADDAGWLAYRAERIPPQF